MNSVLSDYMRDNNLSQAQVAAKLGKSSATINQYLQGKYKGNTTAMDEAVRQLMARNAEKQADVAGDFVKTATALRILETCALAHALCDIYLVIGDAGLGKTVALKEYARQNANVILMEVDPTYTAKVLLMELCGKLGIILTGAKNNHQMMDMIVDKLADSERLLIIDEAELLAYKPLEIIRRIHDKAGIGVVLAGMPRLRANLRGVKGEYKQLYSRIGMALTLPATLPDEDLIQFVEAVIERRDFDGDIIKASHGNARRLSKLLRGVNRLAMINNKPVNAQMIERFTSMLID